MFQGYSPGWLIEIAFSDQHSRTFTRTFAIFPRVRPMYMAVQPSRPSDRTNESVTESVSRVQDPLLPPCDFSRSYGNSHLPQIMKRQVADMVRRLSTGDWFTAKVSACGLFTAAYKHISEPDQRTVLRAQV